MKVFFQIVHNSENIESIIFDSMKEAYSNLYIEKSDDEVNDLFEIKYNLQLKNSRLISGFEIEVEELTDDEKELISEKIDTFLGSFTGKIRESQHIFAIIKLHDETRFETYLNFYKEIACLEMRLREILSFIFYYEYSDDLYNLLEEYEVNINKGNLKQEELQQELQERLENEFFYLNFSHYLKLDKPKEIRHVKDISSILESSDSYEAFKNKVCNRGIKNEKHLEFLAAIKQDLETVEGVRNAIAHNRTISNTKLGHYETAKEHLIQSFQEFWEENEEKSKP